MPEIDMLQEAIKDILTPKTLLGRRILITAGATQEPLDPVRFISNYSTGKMGFALAQACARRGADVTLVCGAVSVPLLDPFERIHRIDALSAQAMYEHCLEAWPSMDTAILCAAVADFTPEETASAKIKKQAGQTELTLHLKTTPDIAKALGESKQAHQQLIGFALETDHEKENALRKLERKHLDFIVLNSLREKGAGFGTDTNRVTLLFASGNSEELPLQSKADIAEGILEFI
jgi:phosphopantothenoylcysteine decarboxylase/phosphopantothenate--cysteine ligase